MCERNTEFLNTNAGLSYDTNEPVLKNEFEKYGEVVHGKIFMKSIIPLQKSFMDKQMQFLSFFFWLDVKVQ